MAIVSERDWISPEDKTGKRSSEPEVVILTGPLCFVKAADRVEHATAEDGHDEDCAFVRDKLLERDYATICAERALWLPVQRSAKKVRVARDQVRFRVLVEDGHL